MAVRNMLPFERLAEQLFRTARAFKGVRDPCGRSFLQLNFLFLGTDSRMHRSFMMDGARGK